MTSGVTFREAIAQYSPGITMLDSLTQFDPTLTISIPFIDSINNANNWQKEDFIPKVIFRNQKMDDNRTKLLFFDHTGKEHLIDRYRKPRELVLVVKSNERLNALPPTPSSKNSVRNSLQNTEGIFAYFVDEEFNNLQDRRTIRNTLPDGSWQIYNIRNEKNFYAYFNQTDSHRDYVYYGIDINRQQNTGPLNSNYAEYLTAISFVSAVSYDKVADKNDPLGDWSEGSLEIYIDLIFNRRNGAAYNLRKVLHIPIDKLFIMENGQSVNTMRYTLQTPLELFVWDFYEFGDTYKVSASEYDVGTEITTTHTVTSTFSQNFENNAGVEIGPVKIGSKYGSSYTESKTSSIITKLTNNSDQLGELFVNFFDPVYTQMVVRIFPSFLSKPITKTFKYNEETAFRSFVASYPNASRMSIDEEKYYSTGTMNFYILPLEKR